MIPLHDKIDDLNSDLKVVKLSALTKYDTTKPHRHNYFEFFIFDNGKGVHDIDFEDIGIESKSMHIVAPGQVHQVRRELDTNGYVILFKGSIFRDNKVISKFLLDHVCFPVNELSPVYQFKDAPNRLIDLANLIWQEYQNDDDLKLDLIKNYLSNICLQCYRTIEDKSNGLDKNSDLYAQFRRLLSQKFLELKKVKDYAKALNITDKKLNEIVNLKTGLSCSALIYSQIILEAKRLLKTNISTKEVAYHLNFEDPSHFSKFFKKQTGISPSEFQKIHLIG